MPDPAQSVEVELRNLRSAISDLSHQIDAYKTKTAAAIGGGVFSFLLAALAIHDIVVRKSGVWLARGITRETLIWTAIALVVSAVVLLCVGIARAKRRDVELEGRLERMEHRYAELLDRKARTPN